jgi:hypothetical protein
MTAVVLSNSSWKLKNAKVTSVHLRVSKLIFNEVEVSFLIKLF